MHRTAAVVLLALAACNEAPVLSSVAIGPDSPTTLDALKLDIGEITDINHREELDVIISWSVNGQAVPTLDGAYTVPASLTAAGDIWAAKVVATDGDAESLPWTALVRIGNTAPVVSMSLSPEAPQPGEAITAVVTTADEDDDTVELVYHWLRDGQPFDNVGPTLPEGITQKGERWTVSAVPSDGTDSGIAAIEDVVVGNTAPVVHTVGLISDTGYANEDLRVSTASTDVDGDGIIYRYAWLVDGEPVDATGPILPSSHFSRDQRVDVWVVASDGTAQSEAVRGSIVIGNAPPTLDSATLSTTSAGALDTLACSPGTGADIDGDDLYYLYYWQVNGELRGRADTFSSGFERGDSVACVVLVADGTDSGEPVTTEPVVIGNTAPFAQGLQLTTGQLDASTAGAVSVVGAVDPDGDTIEYRYQWTVNGAPVTTAATISSSSYGKGAVVGVTVIPTDGFDDGAPLTGSWTVANSAPRITSAFLDGDNVEGGSLTALTAAEDADGEPLTITTEWRVNGAVAPVTGDTLSSDHFDRGQAVSALVTVTDGDGAFDATTLGPYIIANAAPTLAGVSIDQSEARVGSTLSATIGQSDDADGDTLTTTFTWLVDGVTAGTGTTFEVPAVAAGSLISLRAEVSDGFGGSARADAGPLPVINGAPTLSDVTILPASGVTRDTVLLADWTGSDPEGDTLDAAYQWTVNGTPIDADTISIPVWLWASKGDSIGLSVVATDGGSLSEPLAATPVVVGNSAPYPVTASLGSGDIDPSFDLTCDIGTAATDPDGDAVSYRFVWLIDGDEYTGTTSDTVYPGDTIPAEQVGLAESWECGVTVTDGEDDSSTSYASADVDFGHSAIGGRFISGSTAIYRTGPVLTAELTGAQDYADLCTGMGLAPVSCDSTTYGATFDASAYFAIELDSGTFGCDVSAGVASETGWSSLASLHEPDFDIDGFCVEGCAEPAEWVWLVCAAALD